MQQAVLVNVQVEPPPATSRPLASLQHNEIGLVSAVKPLKRRSGWWNDPRHFVWRRRFQAMEQK